MAERTATNVGEPADERSVDGNSRPFPGRFSEGGDMEMSNNGAGSSSGDFNKSFEKIIPDLDSSNRPEFHSFYEEQDEQHAVRSSTSTEDWDNKSAKDSHLGRSNVFFKIMPLLGAASYEYFSIKIMNPSWFLRVLSGTDERVSNLLWIQSHLGIGFYIYSRKHIQALSLPSRLIYSSFGSLLFNYGSCLFWAIFKTYLPRIIPARVTFGLMTGGVMLYVGKEYLKHVDKTCSDQVD